MSDLKNPMRWSFGHKTCDIEGWLDHKNEVDDVERRVTEIDIRPGEGNIYVHWEYVNVVECVYCEEHVSHGEISSHHTEEHPKKRWNPAYYPEVYDDG